MKIQEIKINRFKRFTDLTVTDIPKTTKIVVLVGPNGSGKTSLFEALYHYYKFKGFNNIGNKDYLEKKDGEVSDASWYQNKVNIKFHDNPPLDGDIIKDKFYFRTAYRNESDFSVNGLRKLSDPSKSIRIQNLMENDMTVSENYQRLVAQTLAGVYDQKNDSKTVEQLREELIGKIKISLSNIFDDLKITSIGDPLANGSFFFEKGVSTDFHYKNLSAGEKSAFDLILDIIIKSLYYPEAILCIDEPEAHMHTRLQSKILKELYRLTPENSQLWISTHSIGMLKEAEEIEKDNPNTVVFLDFDNRDFDLTEVMKPAHINRAIWDRFYDLAFADFSQLIAPSIIVFCEGTSQGRKIKDFDAQIYEKIFEEKYYDTKFVSVGSSTELENIENRSLKIVANILKSSKIIKFVDRDDKSDKEVKENAEKGIKTSKRRHIECYLLDNELIIKLCRSIGKPELISDCINAKEDAIQDSINRGNPPDDIKSASGTIFNKIKKILGLTQCGNNVCAFLRDTMAPLVTEDTEVYKELENEIFN